jgi:hypothetical protein
MFANRYICGRKVPCVVLYIIVVLMIVVYGVIIRRAKIADPLARPIYSHPILQDIDGWSISHLVFFGILGLLYPNHHLQFLTVGALWEVIETGLGQNKLEVSGKRLQLIGDQDVNGAPTGKDDAYWYGKESDIVVDIFGYSVGSWAANRFWPNACEADRAPAGKNTQSTGKNAPRAGAPRRYA